MLQSTEALRGLAQCRDGLRAVFGLEDFRPGQWDAIESLLTGTDTVVVMPTGGGKSLIYQLPAALREDGLTLVVSPLIALMKDQTDALKALGVAAEFCNSTQDELEQMRVISHAVTGKIRLLYVSPERAVSADFLSMLPRMPVTMIAIDEAHCISQWGHDFRPDYRELHRLRSRLAGRNVPVAALTATATDRVKGDIIAALDLGECRIVQQSFYRPNLIYNIEYVSTDKNKEARLLELLERGGFRDFRSGRCIVYCATRGKVDSLYDFLRSNGYKTGRYHAGKSAGIREKTQNSYSAGKVNVLVATNAFGMGMDQPDVRMVVHYQVPSSIEAYYQESGRGGRDGRESHCILFFSKADFVTQNFILGKGRRGNVPSALLEKVQAYGFSDMCRQSFLCGYFGERIAPCQKCDHCLESGASQRSDFLQNDRKQREAKEERASRAFSDEEVAAVHGVLREFPGKFGKKILAGILRGSKSRDIQNYRLHRSAYFASMQHVPQEAIVRLFEVGIEDGTFQIVGSKYPKVYLASEPPVKKKVGTGTRGRTGASAASSPDARLLRQLRSFRDNEAKRLRWKKYMVMQNAVLARIAKDRPRSLDDLSSIKGLGAAKTEKFGAEVLRIVREERDR